MQPLLLDIDRIGALNAEEFSVGLLNRLGEVVSEARSAGHALAVPEWDGRVSSDNIAVWRRRWAEEILLAKASGITLFPEIMERLGAERPFDEPSPLLSDVIDHSCAVVVIPLDDGPGKASASMAHLWVIRDWKGDDHSGAFDGVAEWKARRGQYSLFHAGLKGLGLSGQSWQLAACCACELMDSPEHVFTLAGKWMVSGRVEDDSVRDVEVLKKQTLLTRRTWLLPLENQRDLTPRFLSLNRVRLTASVSNAVRLITGEGVVEGGTETLPSNPDVLFTFVSEAWLVIAALVLLTRPRKLVLWHTRDETKSIVPARRLVELLARCCPEVKVEPLQPISSHSMAECETTLREAVEHVPSGTTTLFNITNGNMLMRLAAHGICRLYPDKVRLIYRDLDAQPFEYTGIRFEGSPVTTILSAEARLRTNDYAWDHLFALPREYRELRAVEEIEKFIRKNPNNGP